MMFFFCIFSDDVIVANFLACSHKQFSIKGKVQIIKLATTIQWLEYYSVVVPYLTVI